MMLLVNSVEPAEWDAFVAGCANGHFMQSFSWGRFQRAMGWQSHYLAWREDGQLVATALLLSRGIPLLPWRIFYAPRGPVVCNPTEDRLHRVGLDVQKYLRGEGGIFARFDPYLTEREAVKPSAPFTLLERTWSYWNAPKYVFWLDLQGTEDEVFKKMDKNCQRDIRAGYKRGVSFEFGSKEDLPDFYRLLVSMSNTKGIAHHDLQYYELLMTEMAESARVGLFLARVEGRLISTGMSIKYGNKAWLLYAASDREYSKLRVNRNIQWEMIRWAKELGCSRYDFRGTATGDPPSPSDPGYGVYEYKRSFGPEFVRTTGYWDIPVRTLGYRAFRSVEERALPLAYQAKVWLSEKS